MRAVVLAIAVVAICVSQAAATNPDYKAQFERFKADFGRKYHSTSEETRRFHIFTQNMKIADSLHARNPQATFGPNEFADLSPAEFKVRHNGEKHFEPARAKIEQSPIPDLFPRNKAIAQSVDWRAKGAVTEIKNQGQCGSCWSFSTTGGIEGQWFLAGNKLVSLSEQELVSCDTIDDGCNGGLMNSAMDWLLGNTNGVITTEAAYPYVSGDGNVPGCNSTGLPFGAQIAGHHNVPHDESQMAAFVAARGPLSIAVDATAFQLYMGGVMTDCGGQQLDHGVLIVGYDLSYSTPYWIIKNSWGQSWGENGYIRVAYGSDQCLLTHYPVTSLIHSTVAPTPAPLSSGTFQHIECDDQACSQGCDTNVFQQNACISWDGVSFVAQCSGSSVTITSYPYSLNCTGSPYQLTQPTSQCLQDQDFTYYQNICPSSFDANALLINGLPIDVPHHQLPRVHHVKLSKRLHQRILDGRRN